MPPALDECVKDRVRRLWFSGETRKNIATECGVGAGSVTNIINEFMKSLESADYVSIRELALDLKKDGSTLTKFASIYRRHNYVEKLGANEEQIELMIANLLDGERFLPQEKIVDLINQGGELARIKSLSLEERRLKKSCKIWESHATRYKQVLTLCEQVTRLGIGIEELMAYHSAVVKRADEDHIPIGAAPYRIMTDIDYYNRRGGLMKELNEAVMDLQWVNLVSAYQRQVMRRLL